MGGLLKIKVGERSDSDWIQSGWIKLNTDGTCDDDGRIGCGGVSRGSEGEWLGGYAKFIGKGNPLHS
jgi:hypothetical protein